jgi:guanylate kinase
MILQSNPSKRPPLFVVSGASGSGKTSICRKIATEFGLYYSVSHTTRPKRAKEVEGKDYFFVSAVEFKALIKAGEFLEWAQVYDNYYGTSKRIIEEKLAKGSGVILDVDTQGAASIKTLFPDAVLIFLNTPSLKDLQDRLTMRGRDSNDEIKKRVAYAENENAKMAQYDYVILNDDFDRAVGEVKGIVAKQWSPSTKS